MPKRTIGNLLKVRQASVTETRSLLADALAAERIAAEDETIATTAIHDEVAAASALSANDGTVEALGAWLPQARVRQTAARERRQAAEVATARARAALAAARAAEAAIESLIEVRKTEERLEAERRAQADLNEHFLTRLTKSNE